MNRHLRLMHLVSTMALPLACNQGGEIVHVQKPAAVAGHSDAVGCSKAGMASMPGCSANATPGLVDVVVLVALNGSAGPIPSKLGDSLLDLTKDMAEGVGAGLKFSLIAKGASGFLQKPDSGLSAANAKSVDFDLKPNTALLGALVAGCSKASSSFPSAITAIAEPLVCGEKLLSVEGNTKESLGQGALASLEPLRESLSGFLRSGTRRAYIIISDGDAEFMTGEVLTTIVKAQNGGIAAPVYVLAPMTDGASGDCGADAKAAKTYPDVTHDTSGVLYSVCDKDWSKSIHAIIASIAKLK